MPRTELGVMKAGLVVMAYSFVFDSGPGADRRIPMEYEEVQGPSAIRRFTDTHALGCAVA